ncbi:hypothetical protein NKG05_13115 [Oerskovia sp. M15]
MTSLGRTAATGFSTVARRSAVVAASSGLLISVFTAPANAAPASDQQKASLGTVDLGAVTAQAREALQTSPTVTVASDASLAIEQAPVAVTPAPEPEPEPEPPRPRRPSAPRRRRAASSAPSLQSPKRSSRRPPRRPQQPRARRSSTSRCGTSACRTSTAAPRRAASTAPA